MYSDAAQNKTLSDDTAPILTGQGVSWFLRKAVSMGTVTLSITHSRDDAGVETLHADQVLTGGLGGITETRVLDWEQRDWDNLLLGKCVVKTKRVTVAELEEEYLREGWTAESQKHGVILEFVESGQKNGGKGWSTYMVSPGIQCRYQPPLQL